MRNLIVGIAVILLATACNDPSDPGRSHSTVGPHPSAASSEEDGALSDADAEILAVVKAIDQNEVAAAQQAREHQLAPGVDHFAAMMVKDHTENQQQIERLGETIEGDRSRAERAKGEATLEALKSNTDHYSEAYVDAMVKGHQEALNLIDHTLLPDAEAEGVKALLTNTRMAVQKHLQAAKALQDTR